jgi:hypothetical protein
MEPHPFKAFCEEFHRDVNRLRMEENAAANAKGAELNRVEHRMRRIVELITDDEAPVRALKQELVSLEGKHRAKAAPGWLAGGSCSGFV